jgi:lysophospholipase L1-like esterase
MELQVIKRSVLCYGDSNTWGYVPTSSQSLSKSRFSRDERWTGVLQTLLGVNYYVIEEGLNSRTTNIDYQVPPDRNGRNYLPPCLYSHSPLDLVLFALGGNDCKTYFNRSAEAIRDGMAELIDVVQGSIYGPDLNKAPEVLLISSPIPLPIAETFKDENGVLFMEGAIHKLEKLRGLYEELAKEKKCHYLDISYDIQSSEIDGVHLDLQGHAKFSQLISEKIRQIFNY